MERALWLKEREFLSSLDPMIIVHRELGGMSALRSTLWTLRSLLMGFPVCKSLSLKLQCGLVDGAAWSPPGYDELEEGSGHRLRLSKGKQCAFSNQHGIDRGH